MKICQYLIFKGLYKITVPIYFNNFLMEIRTTYYRIFYLIFKYFVQVIFFYQQLYYIGIYIKKKNI